MQGPLETRRGPEDAVLALGHRREAAVLRPAFGPGLEATLTFVTGCTGRPAGFQPRVA